MGSYSRAASTHSIGTHYFLNNRAKKDRVYDVIDLTLRASLSQVLPSKIKLSDLLAHQINVYSPKHGKPERYFDHHHSNAQGLVVEKLLERLLLEQIGVLADNVQSVHS